MHENENLLGNLKMNVPLHRKEALEKKRHFFFTGKL